MCCIPKLPQMLPAKAQCGCVVMARSMDDIFVLCLCLCFVWTKCTGVCHSLLVSTCAGLNITEHRQEGDIITRASPGVTIIPTISDPPDPPVSTTCVAKRRINEVPSKEPWSRQKGHDGSPLLVCFHLRILLKDEWSDQNNTQTKHGHDRPKHTCEKKHCSLSVYRSTHVKD
jgi:hypothetical protein